MATGRAHLQSVMAWCADLQERTDEELESVQADLAEADNLMDNIVDTFNSD